MMFYIRKNSIKDRSKCVNIVCESYGNIFSGTSVEIISMYLVVVQSSLIIKLLPYLEIVCFPYASVTDLFSLCR